MKTMKKLNAQQVRFTLMMQMYILAIRGVMFNAEFNDGYYKGNIMCEADGRKYVITFTAKPSGFGYMIRSKSSDESIDFRLHEEGKIPLKSDCAAFMELAKRFVKIEPNLCSEPQSNMVAHELIELSTGKQVFNPFNVTSQEWLNNLDDFEQQSKEDSRLFNGNLQIDVLSDQVQGGGGMLYN